MRKYFTLIVFCGSFFLAEAQQSARKRTYTIAKADSLFLAQKWADARREYEGALPLEENQQNAQAWNRLGVSCFNLGDYNAALAHYKKSLESKPSAALLPFVHARIARVYGVKKEPEKSMDHLEQAVAVGYSNLDELDTAREFTTIRRTEKFGQIVDKAGINAFPCRANAQAREFDFWVGEWNVFATGTNFTVGRSSIQKASGDCMILENWTAIGPMPHNGKSMNYVNPETGKWEQLWIGSNGRGNNVTRFYNGEYKDSAMRFEFEMKTPQGKQAGRFSFFNQGPDQVRQLSETSADGGKTWTINYDFTYKRK